MIADWLIPKSCKDLPNPEKICETNKKRHGEHHNGGQQTACFVIRFVLIYGVDIFNLEALMDIPKTDTRLSNG